MIVAQSQELAERYDQSNSEVVHAILAQVARIQNTLNAYLRFENSEVRTPRLKPVDLSAIVNECVLLLAASSEEGTRLELTQVDGLLPVFADETQFSQIICNLALNSQQSAGNSGRVAITTGRQVIEGTRQVYLKFAVDGPALVEPPLNPLAEEQDELFIVKRIVDMHGGSFSVESPRADIKRGVRYTIRLPELIEYHI